MPVLRRRPPSPPRPARPTLIGTVAPPIDGVRPDGAPVGVAAPTTGRLVVVFLTTGCQGCTPVWSALGDHPGVVVVTPGPGTESRRALARRVDGDLPVVMSSETWFAWDVRGAPWLAVVDDGLVSAEGPADPATLRTLLAPG